VHHRDHGYQQGIHAAAGQVGHQQADEAQQGEKLEHLSAAHRRRRKQRTIQQQRGQQ